MRRAHARPLATWTLAALGTMPASAEAMTWWLCGLSESATQVVCVADADPHVEVTTVPERTATVRGTAFPLDPRRRWTVDLWSPATDLDHVEQLARATICYRSPACAVVFASPRR